MTLEVALGPEVRDIQGSRIKSARDWARLSQRELAELVSTLIEEPISYNIISKIEKGERDATSREIRAISYITAQDQSWLEGGDGYLQEVSQETITERLSSIEPFRGSSNRFPFRRRVTQRPGPDIDIDDADLEIAA